MAWIESHQSLREHPKTRKAAKLLDISAREVVGYLMFLWWWALDYAQDGDLSCYSTDDIEMAVDWDGEPGALVDALADCGFGGKPGFLERTESGLVIHDWYEYAGKLIDRRRDDAQRKRASRKGDNGSAPPPRIPADVPGSTGGLPADGARTNQPTVPTVPTVPNGAEAPKAPEIPQQASQKPAPPKEKAKREPTEYDKLRARLERCFSEYSGLPVPAHETEAQKKSMGALWWVPLTAMYAAAGKDEQKTLDLMRAALTKMDTGGLTISSPKSIQAVFLDMARKGNGHTAPPARRTEKVYS